ncbi:MAG: hypothetical protein RMY29_020300 [Nostoc sp. CreGUA01]|nr:hypothetical protein [Nostoc sp. CreGUA01]
MAHFTLLPLTILLFQAITLLPKERFFERGVRRSDRKRPVGKPQQEVVA